MALPVIIAVEEDSAVFENVSLQLAERYQRSYRIESLRHAGEAAEVLQRLAQDGADLALLLADLPALRADEGGLFDEARHLHPQAKRVLLASPNVWMDAPRADLIRAAMGLGRIDYFVLDPGQPPDEIFHEAVSGFLLEWARERRLVASTVRIVGDEWAGRAYDLRATFENCAVPHAFALADSEEGRELLEQAGPDVRLPLIALPDGTMLSDPSNAEIAAAAGAPQRVEDQTFDLLVVGAGPAGLSSAVYGASEGLEVVVVDSGGIGGQARSSSLIRNYLGFAKGVSGSRLAEQAYEQAAVFGADFVFMHRATGLTRSGENFALWLEDGRSISARTLILATGASYRRLGIRELEELTGAGVFYGGPVSEAPTLAGKAVYVLGGGNSAGQAALHLARYARTVTIVIRGAGIEAGMSQYLVRAIGAAPNVDVRIRSTVTGGGGAGRLERLVLRDSGTGEEETVPADALFVLIGAHPMTEWLPRDLARDSHGFLLTGDELDDVWPLERRPFSLETSVPRVFAAGDVRHGSVKRVAAAVGEGAAAVQHVHRALAEDEQLAADPKAT